MLTYPRERTERSDLRPTDRTLLVRMIWTMLGMGAGFSVLFDLLRRAVGP